MEVRDRVALVTGGGAGIGRAVAFRLAREGASVVVSDMDEEAGSGTIHEIESEDGKASFFRADVASEADARGMVAFAEEEFGGLDVLVNNAGGVSEPYFPDGEPGHWGRAIDLNLRGVMLGIHFGVRAMKRRGGGAIVNVSSVGEIGNSTTSPSMARPRPASSASPPRWPTLRSGWAFASTAYAPGWWTPLPPGASKPG